MEQVLLHPSASTHESGMYNHGTYLTRQLRYIVFKMLCLCYDYVLSKKAPTYEGINRLSVRAWPQTGVYESVDDAAAVLRAMFRIQMQIPTTTPAMLRRLEIWIFLYASCAIPELVAVTAKQDDTCLIKVESHTWA